MSLIKSEKEILLMKEASKIVAIVHRELKKMIIPGIKLSDLDKKAEEIILSYGAKPTFKGYEGFPSSICASVNDVMVHGIPTDQKLINGDIISIDVGVMKDGWNGDAAFTSQVGEVSDKATLLMKVTKLALEESIKFAKPGITLGELGRFIESFAIDNNFTVAKDYVGHGIGRDMHEDPLIPNYGFEGGEVLKEGMTICIEPMFIDGKDKLFVDPFDKWTVRTKHGGITTHDEHTIVIRKNGGEILTKI